MAVPNRFSTRTDDRLVVLRALATIGALVGVGTAFTHLTTPAGLTGYQMFGLWLAAALGIAVAARVWMIPRWDATHSSLTLFAGVVWLVFAFTAAASTATLPVILGAALTGTGLGGFTTDPTGAFAPVRA